MATYQVRKGKTKTSVTATVRKDGKSISRTFPSKAKAKAWAGEVEGAIDARKYNDPRLAEQVSLEVALDKYYRTVSIKKAATTYDVEARTIKNIKKGIGADTSLAEITPRVVAEYRDKREGEVSAYTVRRELALLSHMFQKARREWELPVENPVKQIDRPKAPRGRKRFLTIPEALRLLDECNKSRNKKLAPYILTLLQTGMRASEAARLRWDQVDLGTRQLYLDQTKTVERSVPLTQTVCQCLTAIKPDDDPGNALIFLTEEELTRPKNAARPSLIFRQSWQHARKRAGITDVRMHDLRHTAGTWMLARGVDIRIIAAILGHATMEMVLRYTHVVDAAALAAIDTIGDLGIKKPTDQIA
ncbi:MAG: site-specific integrase [Proteobacteria bacterium]|nr:site-specific integrase [Pseudomonadota bacterium]MBU1640060.1 site-specific integrase [Pseudomonadota bacterium]